MTCVCKIQGCFFLSSALFYSPLSEEKKKGVLQEVNLTFEGEQADTSYRCYNDGHVKVMWRCETWKFLFSFLILRMNHVRRDLWNWLTLCPISSSLNLVWAVFNFKWGAASLPLQMMLSQHLLVGYLQRINSLLFLTAKRNCRKALFYFTAVKIMDPSHCVYYFKMFISSLLCFFFWALF